MDLKFNNFGKVKFEQIKELDLAYTDEKDDLVTYSELKDELYERFGLRINWNYEERASYALMWLCSKLNRGCSPLYITDDVYVKLKRAQTK